MKPRRLIIAAMILALALSLLPAGAAAEAEIRGKPADSDYGYVSGSTTLFFDESTGTITGSQSEAAHISIPKSIRGVSVTAIGEDAFRDNQQLASITLPASLDSIGENAFRGCTGLVSAAIPEGVTLIGQSAFEGCSALDMVALPASVSSIQYDAFYGTTIQDVYYSGSSTDWDEIEIGGYNGALTETGIHYSSTPNPLPAPSGSGSNDPEQGAPDTAALRGNAHEDDYRYYSGGTTLYFDTYTGYITGSQSEASHVVIPDAILGVPVMAIGKEAFRDNKDIASIELPASLVYIGANAFRGCSRLVSVEIPEGVTLIGASAFEGCSALNVAALPTSVSSIRSDAFYSTDLKDVYYRGTNTAWTGIKIGSYNGALTEANIHYNSTPDPLPAPSAPGSVDPSRGAPDTAELKGNVNEDDYRYYSGGTTLYFDTHTGYITGSQSEASHVTIPRSILGVPVKAIGKEVFRDNKFLASVTLPSSLVYIGDNAFRGCSRMPYAEIPAGVTVIGNSAFEGCSTLDAVTIPASVRSIGSDAFYSTDLQDVYYSGDDGRSWSKIKIGSYNGQLTEANFHYGSKPAPLPAPSGSGSADPEQGAPDSAKLRGNVHKDDYRYYAGGTTLYFDTHTGYITGSQSEASQVTIPDAILGVPVKGIGKDVFYGNEFVESVTLPSSLVYMESNAFRGCKKLASIRIPSGTVLIGHSAFEGCSALTSVALPTSVNTIQSDAFYGTGLQEVYYDGDSVDWNKIEIGSYNDALKNASIHYFCATEIRKVTADEETVTAEINCQRDRTDAAAWCAFYRKNGQMIQAETAPLNAAQRNRVTFTVPEGTDTIQWFAVDSGSKPLCESMTVR